MNSAATIIAALRKADVLSRSVYIKMENTTFSLWQKFRLKINYP